MSFADFPPPFDGGAEEGRPEDGAEGRDLTEREVSVLGVFQESDHPSPLGNPFVLLRDGGDRCVRIWVGPFEAAAISVALEGTPHDRPLTHELVRNVAEKLGAKITRVVIDDLFDMTFYAKIWLTVGETDVLVDSRPSDGIAVALRAKCPLFMTEAVLQEASVPAAEIEGESEGEDGQPPE